MSDTERNIEALLSEKRVFEPSAAFVERAVISDRSIYDRAEDDPVGFWAEQAERISWFRRWDEVMERDAPWVKWFTGGTLNASYNCLDRHVEAGGGDKVAYHWEGEPGDTRTITYRDLYEETCRFANALKGLGVRRGDRVAIYLGMVPELPVAMLACARIGAPHSVVFGGFSAESLKDRINDAEATVLITADGGYRRGQIVPLKESADTALTECPTIQHVVTVRRTGGEHTFTPGRDHWYHELIAEQPAECSPEEMDAEDFLYLLYTSGTTGKPKGIAHTTGGYITQVAATHRMIFDIHEDDVFWCAADIGWVTGHSYIVYGPLANHTTGIIYEGAPDWPDKDRLWAIAEKYKATILYTAPTAIRAFMRWGTRVPREPRPLLAATARLGRRAHQPRGVGLVLEVHRRRALSRRRHVVADGDRRHPDLTSAGRHRPEARVRHPALPRDRGRRLRRCRELRAAGRRRVPGADAPVAGHRPHDLGRPRSLREHVLQQVRAGGLRGGRRRRSGTRRATTGCSAGSMTS